MRLWDASTRKQIGAALTGHKDFVCSVALRLVESNTLRRVGRGSNPVRRPVSRSEFKFEFWPRPKLGTETTAGPGAVNSRLYMELSLKA